MDNDDRIATCCERGVHIALTCKQHPEKRWSTKNVGGYIGARTIFYNLSAVENMGAECPCPLSDLHHIHQA